VESSDIRFQKNIEHRILNDEFRSIKSVTQLTLTQFNHPAPPNIPALQTSNRLINIAPTAIKKNGEIIKPDR